mmetsp:Transcript_28233/g.65992  ORF Transcript_28233/g.65992 Transcript_28233/m.65992 type:complete len:221 (+) Transcript_28233:226-888(+)
MRAFASSQVPTCGLCHWQGRLRCPLVVQAWDCRMLRWRRLGLSRKSATERQAGGTRLRNANMSRRRAAAKAWPPKATDCWRAQGQADGSDSSAKATPWRCIASESASCPLPMTRNEGHTSTIAALPLPKTSCRPRLCFFLSGGGGSTTSGAEEEGIVGVFPRPLCCARMQRKQQHKMAVHTASTAAPAPASRTVKLHAAGWAASATTCAVVSELTAGPSK